MTWWRISSQKHTKIHVFLYAFGTISAEKRQFSTQYGFYSPEHSPFFPESVCPSVANRQPFLRSIAAPCCLSWPCDTAPHCRLCPTNETLYHGSSIHTLPTAPPILPAMLSHTLQLSIAFIKTDWRTNDDR